MIKDLLNIPERDLSVEEYRDWIEEAENAIKDSVDTLDRHSCINHGFKLEHAVTPGLYTREFTMPAEQIVFSRVHMQTHPYIITKGKVTVYDGVNLKTYEAPYKGITPAGTKRVLYTHEETTWITFHPTDLDDVEEIDKSDTITCDTFADYKRLGGEL